MSFSNLAPWDRLVRLGIGAAMLTAGWTLSLSEVIALALRVLGWIPVLTAVLGWSPLYSLLNISTRRRRLARR